MSKSHFIEIMEIKGVAFICDYQIEERTIELSSSLKVTTSKWLNVENWHKIEMTLTAFVSDNFPLNEFDKTRKLYVDGDGDKIKLRIIAKPLPYTLKLFLNLYDKEVYSHYFLIIVQPYSSNLDHENIPEYGKSNKEKEFREKEKKNKSKIATLEKNENTYKMRNILVDENTYIPQSKSQRTLEDYVVYKATPPLATALLDEYIPENKLITENNNCSSPQYTPSKISSLVENNSETGEPYTPQPLDSSKTGKLLPYTAARTIVTRSMITPDKYSPKKLKDNDDFENKSKKVKKKFSDVDLFGSPDYNSSDEIKGTPEVKSQFINNKLSKTKRSLDGWITKRTGSGKKEPVRRSSTKIATKSKKEKCKNRESSNKEECANDKSDFCGFRSTTSTTRRTLKFENATITQKPLEQIPEADNSSIATCLDKSETIHGALTTDQILSCRHLDIGFIIGTFSEFRFHLDKLIEDYLRQDTHFVKQQTELDFTTYTDILSEKQVLEMLSFLTLEYKSRTKFSLTSLFAELIVPEWALHLFGKVYSMNRKEVIEYIKLQEAKTTFDESDEF